MKEYNIDGAKYSLNVDKELTKYSEVFSITQERWEALTDLCKAFLYNKALPEEMLDGITLNVSTDGRDSFKDAYAELMRACTNHQEVMAVSFILGLQVGKNANKQEFYQIESHFIASILMAKSRAKNNLIKTVSDVASQVIEEFKRRDIDQERIGRGVVKSGVFTINKSHPNYQKIEKLQEEMVKLMKEGDEEEDRTKIG